MTGYTCTCDADYTQTSATAPCNNLVTLCDVPDDAIVGSVVTPQCQNGGSCQVWEQVLEFDAEWQNETGDGEWVTPIETHVNVTCECEEGFMGDQCEIGEWISARLVSGSVRDW